MHVTEVQSLMPVPSRMNTALRRGTTGDHTSRMGHANSFPKAQFQVEVKAELSTEPNKPQMVMSEKYRGAVQAVIPCEVRHGSTRQGMEHRRANGGLIQSTPNLGTRLILIVDGTNAADSVVHSTIPWNVDVPPDNKTLTYRFLPTSASYLVLYLLERSTQAPDHADLLHK